VSNRDGRLSYGGVEDAGLLLGDLWGSILVAGVSRCLMISFEVSRFGTLTWKATHLSCGVEVVA
jgi:hypothetical protein